MQIWKGFWRDFRFQYTRSKFKNNLMLILRNNERIPEHNKCWIESNKIIFLHSTPKILHKRFLFLYERRSKSNTMNRKKAGANFRNMNEKKARILNPRGDSEREREKIQGIWRETTDAGFSMLNLVSVVTPLTNRSARRLICRHSCYYSPPYFWCPTRILLYEKKLPFKSIIF